MTRRTSVARLLLILAAGGAAAVARWLVLVDGPEPPPLDPSRWVRWWTGRAAIDVVAGLARVAALAAVVVAVVAVVAALHAAARGRAGSAWWTRWLPTAVGAALLTVTTAAVGTVRAGATSDPGASDSAVPAVVVSTVGGDPAGVAPAPVTHLPWAPGAAPEGAPAAPTTVVRPGDHLWSIAATQMARVTGATPSTAAVDPYWRTLVAANRDRLVDPDNPDLILPGQVLVLPPVPPR